MEDYNSIHPGPDIDQGVSDALPGGRLDQAITSAIETAVSRAVAQLAAKYHASQHAADGADPITPAAIGALALTGGDISGHVNIAKRLQVPYFVQTSFGTPNELGQYLDMHISGSKADYDLRLFLDSQKKLYLQSAGSAAQRILTTADMGEGGSGAVSAGTYDGTGTGYVSITAPFVPKSALVYVIDSTASGESYFSRFGFFVSGENGRSFYAGTGTYGLESTELPTSWVDKQISWEKDGGAADALDHSGTTYGYVLWG